MELAEVQKLAARLIEKEEKHQDYKRTVELAETYRIFITGENIKKKLQKFNPRESQVMFDQREALTKATTPATASSVRQPFNKVVRNDRIRKDINLGADKSKKAVVEQMMAAFYGASRKKNKGLDYWMKTRFPELQFIDPNTWIVVEWEKPSSESEVVSPWPFEVCSERVYNFHVVNDDVKWLFIHQPHAYKVSEDENAQLREGSKYTLYEETFTLILEQYEKGFLPYKLAANQREIEIGKQFFIETWNEPKIGYVPAFRIGYKRDESTKGRTFVNPWHDGLCFFEKSLKTVSELDLTMTLHTFPQKIQYVHKCPGMPARDGEPRRRCNDGEIQGTDGEVCGQCGGSGLAIHKSAQDAIFLPMPENKDDMIPLENVLVYKSPPIDLIKWQNDYCLQLERQVHQAVFNSQVFVKKSAGAGNDGNPVQTATEADFNMQAVYDALEPFTEKFSEIWREFVTIFARIAAVELSQIDITHEFPADYKLKTGDILLSERRVAKESGAPAFLIETIDDDLAGIIYQGDLLSLQKYRVKRRFAPFSGKNEDEIAVLMVSNFVPKEHIILYANFEAIFKEIDFEQPDFWNKTYGNQKDIVDKKVQEWVTKIDEQKAEAMPPAFTDEEGEEEEETAQETA